MKKLLCILLAVIFIMSSFSVVAFGATNGWYKSGGVWYYYVDGKVTKGWKQIKGIWYYFSDSGEMCTDLQLINKKYYFFNADGAMQYGGWVESVEKWNGVTYSTWYFAESSGVLTTGWFTQNGNTYYLEPAMAQGEGKKIGGKIYVFKNSGAQVKSAGWSLIQNNWYYLSADFTAITGWVKYKEKWYYLNPDNGIMYSSGGRIVVSSNGKAVPYVFESDGDLTTRTGWISFSAGGKKNWYYLKNSDGIATTGWLKYKNVWYFLFRDGLMATGVTDTGNGVYFLKDDGIWDDSLTDWKLKDGYWYYFKNGKAATGWQTVDGKKYYLDPSTSKMYSNGVYMIGGKSYYFAPSGVSTGVAL